MQPNNLKPFRMKNFSYLSNSHPEYIENLYKSYLENPASVDIEYRKFFDGFDFAVDNQFDQKLAKTSSSADLAKEFGVALLIEAYRNNGHLIADTNPIKKRKDRKANLDLSFFGLSESDNNTTFQAATLAGLKPSTLQDLLAHLQLCYCKTIGFQYNYIRDKEEIAWLRDKIEKNPHHNEFSIPKKEIILKQLNKAVVFEQFLGKKYVGEKRFSLEGCESVIPAIESTIAAAAENGVVDVVIGMAHRGRLNVLANVLGKTYAEIFNEFEGNEPQKTYGDGDVKYHLGFRSNYKTSNQKDVFLELMPNPSHLETVGPIVGGFTRAKADVLYQNDFNKILPILIHGDAAVAGQGIVYETLQMSKLKGYYTGGTVHIVINNQIGFTTDFDDARSSDYAASIARTVDAPILQVNADDIEAVVYVAEMAAEYRQKFKKDVFVDIVGYRKHGHNEGDDPKYTQPLMYGEISKHKNPRDIYVDYLASKGEIEKELAIRFDKEFWLLLQDRLDELKQNKAVHTPQLPEVAWKNLGTGMAYQDFLKVPKTAINKKTAQIIVDALITYPAGFQPIRKVQSYLENRREVMQQNKTVDWAAAELMAYGSILLDGKDVRMSGQDVKRGTFSHRHATIYDEKTNEEYNRLAHLSENQGKFRIYNSHLSEYAVLGFEYGYSMVSPESLVVWEAQFGDFGNTAQALIDQYVVASQSKWNRCSGIIMLLPHGYEGQGPEHSSARLERFLQLCAELNVVITNITDSANFFHAIRRQLAWNFRKPLINMSPKSLLRHPRTQSPIDELFNGNFKPVLDDTDVKDAKKVKRILFCTGKVSFDLMQKRDDEKREDIAIVRLEQLYPIPIEGIDAAIKKYSAAKDYYWVQEEPKNMGVWSFLLARTYENYSFKLVSRKNSASPATGFKKQHIREQQELLDKAFNG